MVEKTSSIPRADGSCNSHASYYTNQLDWLKRTVVYHRLIKPEFESFPSCSPIANRKILPKLKDTRYH